MLTQNGFFSGYSLRNVPLKFDRKTHRRDARRQKMGHSSTSSSSTSISAEHSGQRITGAASGRFFAMWRYEDRPRHPAAYYIPRHRNASSSPLMLSSTPQPRIRGLAEWPFPENIPTAR